VSKVKNQTGEVIVQSALRMDRIDGEFPVISEKNQKNKATQSNTPKPTSNIRSLTHITMNSEI
jgi:hypothetical protein